jgi:hypothetical protein
VAAGEANSLGGKKREDFALILHDNRNLQIRYRS